MRIKTIHKQLLRNMEHYQFAIHVLEMAKEANLEKMKLLFKPLEEAIRHEDEALNPPRIDPATEELRLRDAERPLRNCWRFSRAIPAYSPPTTIRRRVR